MCNRGFSSPEKTTAYYLRRRTGVQLNSVVSWPMSLQKAIGVYGAGNGGTQLYFAQMPVRLTKGGEIQNHQKVYE